MKVRIKRPVKYRSLRYYLNKILRRPDPQSGKIKVVIEDHDVWNVDLTLSRIIVPLLKRYKEVNRGFPSCEEMNSLESWHSIIDQMIWSFEQILDDSWEENFIRESEEQVDEGSSQAQASSLKIDSEAYNEYYEEIQKGIRLFAKYYMTLWS